MGYTGEMPEIKYGEIGILTDLPPTTIPSNALIDARNITLENGLVQKAPGTLLYNSTPLPAGIVGVHDWHPDTVKQRLIAVTEDGNIYRDDGARTFDSNTAITTGLGMLTPNVQFVEGGRETSSRDKKLFLFTDGRRQLKVLEADGTSFADVDAPAADWITNRYPRCGVVHRNRLWAFEGQRAYASDTGNHENFTSNFLTQAIFPGEGGEIIGAYVFKGRLFAFKADGFVYYLEDGNSDSSAWFWKRLASNFGLSAPNAVFDALNDMIAGNTTGTLTSYSATDALGDVESGDLLRNGQLENYIRANFSQNGLETQHAYYYEAKKLAYFTYRSTYKTNNDMLLIIDLNKPTPRFYVHVKGTPQCLADRRDINGVRRPIYGDASGYVHLMDYEDRLEGATAYEGMFQTPHMDFGTSRNKHFDGLTVEYIPEGNWNLSIDYYIDGKYRDTVTVPMQQKQEYLDQFLLDSNRLAQRATERFTVRIQGTGRTISFKCYNSGSNQSFQIASLTPMFRVSGTQASKF